MADPPEKSRWLWRPHPVISHVWNGFWTLERIVGAAGLFDDMETIFRWLAMIPDGIAWYCLGLGNAFVLLWAIDKWGDATFRWGRRQYWVLRGRPNYTIWRGSPLVTLEDSACLWADRVPSKRSLRCQDARRYLYWLIEWGKREFFVGERRPWSGDPKEQVDLWTMTKQVDLICREKNIPMPPFFADVLQHPTGVVGTEIVERTLPGSPYDDPEHLTKPTDDE